MTLGVLPIEHLGWLSVYVGTILGACWVITRGGCSDVSVKWLFYDLASCVWVLKDFPYQWQGNHTRLRGRFVRLPFGISNIVATRIHSRLYLQWLCKVCFWRLIICFRVHASPLLVLNIGRLQPGHFRPQALRPTVVLLNHRLILETQRLDLVSQDVHRLAEALQLSMPGLSLFLAPQAFYFSAEFDLERFNAPETGPVFESQVRNEPVLLLELLVGLLQIGSQRRYLLLLSVQQSE